MTGGQLGLLLAALLLVLLAGLLAGGESALSRLSRPRVEELLRSGRRGAARLRDVLADPARYLNLLTLLRVSCEVAATVAVTRLFLELVASAWQALLLAGLVMVVVSYVAIGVAPRTLGRQHADRVGIATAGFVLPLARVLGPIPALLILIGNALTPGKGFPEGPFATEAELRELVDLAQESRVIEPDERQMIHSVFELGDTIVREVMVPRTDMVFIERGKTLRQAMSLALRSGFSRIPVVGEGADDVVGVVYLKDLARRSYEYHEAEATERVDSAMRPATFVPESKPVSDLLREMQAGNVHMAIVVDEYGGTAGLVTIEDVLEEIVGEITDEYDEEREPVEQLADGSVRVSARLNIAELDEMFGVELADSDVDTVGGLLAKALGKVPIPGASVELSGLRLTAEAGQGRRNRIGTVLVHRVNGRGRPADTDAPSGEEHADA